MKQVGTRRKHIVEICVLQVHTQSQQISIIRHRFSTWLSA